MKHALPTIRRDAVVRLWLDRQGLLTPGSSRFSRQAVTAHLERTGGLQLDTINVLDRAHYLTLWSRFGPYRHRTLDKWLYADRIGYEYWSHEASICPISHLPLGRRRMRAFPPDSWARRAWWKVYQTGTASRRRVMRRLRDEGPLESGDFEDPTPTRDRPGGTMPLPHEDRRSLKLLWHAGKVAVRSRRHFRCLYDLAERVYPDGPVATTAELEDSWVFTGLSGNGVASERHLRNYLTAPDLDAASRKRVLARNVKKGLIVEVRVEGSRERFYARPEDLEAIDARPEPQGTTLICPFDSLLWQRERAEDLLDYSYRIEIYVPPAKRTFGYYVLPILHDGRLVGRLDPKLHRDRGELEIKAIQLEAGVRRNPGLDRGLADALDRLVRFEGATRLALPRGWRNLG